MSLLFLIYLFRILNSFGDVMKVLFCFDMVFINLEEAVALIRVFFEMYLILRSVVKIVLIVGDFYVFGWLTDIVYKLSGWIWDLLRSVFYCW